MMNKSTAFELTRRLFCHSRPQPLRSKSNLTRTEMKVSSLAIFISMVGIILFLSLILYSTPSLAKPQEFVMRADKVAMDNWNMEPYTYGGRTLTKITVKSSEIFGLRLNPLGIDAEHCVMDNLVVYAVYVEGTIHGMTSGWKGSDVPSDALELLLPKRNATMENVTMHILYQKADNMKLNGVEIQSPSSDEPIKIMMPWVKMLNWTMAGPVPYIHSDGETVDTTKVSSEELSGTLSISWKNWKQNAVNSIQENVLVYSTYTKGSAMGFNMKLPGYKKPPEMKATLGDPAMMKDVEQHVVHVDASIIVLKDAELKID